ncbi:hypothetical protein K438DRAFT_1608643, partial [Mycena galopus ATCC 62051]
TSNVPPELPKLGLRCASLAHPIPCYPVPTPPLTSNTSKRPPQSTCPPTLNPITLHAPTSRPCLPTSNVRPPTSNAPRPLITPPIRSSCPALQTPAAAHSVCPPAPSNARLAQLWMPLQTPVRAPHPHSRPPTSNAHPALRLPTANTPY